MIEQLFSRPTETERQKNYNENIAIEAQKYRQGSDSDWRNVWYTSYSEFKFKLNRSKLALG